MSPRALLAEARDVVLRLYPHGAPTGLIAFGQPDRGSPVLLTGNYTLTLRRLRSALRGLDLWLLAANSKGINVWCAASGGHLTHHDVVSVIRTSGIGDRVDHRELILPQLAATGIERGEITRLTGWRPKWGPAHLEDLPRFLRQGQRVRRGDRRVRFPLGDRLEMALMWLLPILAIGAPVLGLLGTWRLALAFTAVASAMVLTLFVGLPAFRLSRRNRSVVFSLVGLGGVVLGGSLLWLMGVPTTKELWLASAGAFIVAGILAVDFEGTTPWYGSFINTFRNHAAIELVEARCAGSADCVLVCPSDVLAMNGRRRKVEIRQPDQCIQCGACIVQCPHDALRFRYEDGRVLPAEVIRETRMNLAGRRAIRLQQHPD
jgi:NAD-dependent dihydropyrimidine dehydrogenase PreA subunit